MGRLIDGDKLIEDLRRYGHENISVDGLEGIIALIPSANPERKTGMWIEDTDDWQYECSECGERYSFDADSTPMDAGLKYCPNCGARMEGIE